MIFQGVGLPESWREAPMGKKRGSYLGGSTIVGPSSPLLGGKPRKPRPQPTRPSKSGWDDVDALFRELGGQDQETPRKAVEPKSLTPKTLGELRLRGLLLEVGCANCGRVAYLNPRNLRFSDEQPVHTVHRLMTCDGCKERGGYSRAGARSLG